MTLGPGRIVSRSHEWADRPRPRDALFAREDGPMVEGDVAERFLSAPLWEEIDRGSRRAVFEAMEESRADAGATLLAEGQPNDRLSFLIEGSAVIERTYPEGRKEVLTTIHAPAAFGTTSFF